MKQIKTRINPTSVERQILDALAKAGDRGLTADELEELVDTNEGAAGKGGKRDEWGVPAFGSVHVQIWGLRNELRRNVTTVRRYVLDRGTKPLPMVLEARAKRQARYGKLAG